MPPVGLRELTMVTSHLWACGKTVVARLGFAATCGPDSTAACEQCPYIPGHLRPD